MVVKDSDLITEDKMKNENHTKEQIENVNDHQVIELSDEQLEKVTGGDDDRGSKKIKPGPKR